MVPGQPDGGPFERDRTGTAPENFYRPGEWPASPAMGQHSAPLPYPPADQYGASGANGGQNGGNGYGDPPSGSPASLRSRPGDAERPPWEEDEPGYASWEWESALQESIRGIGSDDLTGTGKFSAVVPLTPGESAWGRGISAPKGIRPPGLGGAPAVPAAAAAGDVEVDAQLSTRMRALRPGNLARATVIVSVAMMVSRVLGLLRTSLFAAAFGVSPSADAYTYAFTLPDTIFNIVAGGALASAFIPVFTDYLIKRKDSSTAWHVASAAFNLSTLMLTIFAGVCVLFASPILHLLVPTQFTPQPGVTPIGPEIVTLTQVMLLQPIFLGAATMGVAVLQARQRFLLPAIGQVIYTASLIGGILATILDRRTGIFGGHLGIMGPTWSVVAGAALQFVVCVPGLMALKMRYRLTFDFVHPGVRDMFRLMGPRIFNAVASYAAILVTTAWLSSIDTNDRLGYGYRTAFSLMLLPVGLFGMAVSQAAFPTLAALVSDRQWERLRATVMGTLRGMVYLAIPSALGLAMLANPVSLLLLAHGHFDPQYVSVVSVPLIYFSFGLVGLASDEILVRSFYALHDSRTPVLVNCANLAFVLGLSYILLRPMGAGGLALAFALGAVGEAPVLVLLLSPRLGGLDLKALGIFILNVLAASLVTALTALFIYTGCRVVFGTPPSDTLRTVYLAAELMLAIGVATVVYYLFSRFLGIDDAVPLERVAGRLMRMARLKRG